MKETASDIINKYVAEQIESSGKLIDELVDRIYELEKKYQPDDPTNQFYNPKN